MVYIIAESIKYCSLKKRKILCAMGFSERQLTIMAFRQLFKRYCIGLVMGFILGTIASNIFLEELSSSTLKYPLSFDISTIGRAALMCLAPVIAGYYQLRYYLQRMNLAELLKREA